MRKMDEEGGEMDFEALLHQMKAEESRYEQQRPQRDQREQSASVGLLTAPPQSNRTVPRKSKQKPNEPCACASGRKYKRCCLLAHATEATR